MKKRTLLIIVCGTILLECIAATMVSAASVKDMLCNAVLPMGKCLYVYGGGWNEADDAAGIEAMTKGISPMWQEFYNTNDSSYNYKNTRYQIHNGLDCTGFIGWTMYQLFENQYSNNGYVYLSKNMAKAYADVFDGTFVQKSAVADYQCGDIMSSSGHAYIVIGECSDGSVIFLHASPPAVSLCGTCTPHGNNDSEAVRLATYYMRTHFPECYGKYPRCSRGISYLTDYNQMRWSEKVLTDTDGYRNMRPDEILKDVFENIKVYINGERIAKENLPFIYCDTTFVPVREFSEKLDATVNWSGEDKTVRINDNDTEIVIYLLENKMTVNNKEAHVAASALLKDNKTYVPIRFISESLGADVDWDGASKSVTVTR